MCVVDKQRVQRRREDKGHREATDAVVREVSGGKGSGESRAGTAGVCAFLCSKQHLQMLQASERVGENTDVVRAPVSVSQHISVTVTKGSGWKEEGGSRSKHLEDVLVVVGARHAGTAAVARKADVGAHGVALRVAQKVELVVRQGCIAGECTVEMECV